MNYMLKVIISVGIICTGFQVQAGGGKSAAIGLGSGMAGFMIGRATAPRENVVQRETVYVQEPARTVTVQCPYLQRDLRMAQDQLAAERNVRATLESEVSRLRADIARLERHTDYLVQQNVKLENEVKELKGVKTSAPVVTVTTGTQCTAPSCQIHIRKTGTPGMNKPVITDKEQY